MIQTLNLKNLSGDDLDQNLKSLVLKEREVLSVILNHIIEVDIRRLYLTYAYPNLFAYLTQHIGYSAGSAQRRIDAARLSREIPEVITQIEKGEINLAQVSLLQKSCRQVNLQFKKTAESESKMPSAEVGLFFAPNQKVSVETKKVLLSQLAGKSFPESELCVSQILNIIPKDSPKTCFQKDKSVRLEVTLSEAQWLKLSKAKDLISHSVPTGSLDQALEYLCDKIIQQKDKTAQISNRTKKYSKANAHVENKKVAEQKVSTDNQNILAREQGYSVNYSNQLNTMRSRQSIAVVTQREVFKLYSCCQYVDQRTNQKCGSKWQLTLDHLKPVWAGGGNESTNLRVLCANHNREIYRSQASINQVG